ncbi:metallophosphoesterase [Candidatus Endowatersipora endosymbiont of Watersipora subatra]|uniref:metallophosphoesterase family protein n=1 Tax=Candidatus Endowatersipora endosymbiont of Watersipora subatra TaxID=3077946 RepID=UPI00312C7132
MFRLAHISDIHLLPLPSISLKQLISKRIMGYLNWQFDRKNIHNQDMLRTLLQDIKQKNTNHLAITGDLVNLALPSEFEAATKWLKQLGEANEISIVFGNHDCYVESGYRRACESWKNYIGDDRSDEIFPFVRYRKNSALIGVNSGVSTPPFMATGVFDKRQAEHLKKILETAKQNHKFRIIMIHHPPVEGVTSLTKKLHGQNIFRSVIEILGAELILHGHTHVNSLNWIEGPERTVPVIGVASASQRPIREHNLRAATYNLFDIDRQSEEWHCRYQTFGYHHSFSSVRKISDQLLLP